MKNVLFISVRIGDIYKDIMDELTRQGYNVDYIVDKVNFADPRLIRSRKFYSRFPFNRQRIFRNLKNYWCNLLAQDQYSKCYDYLFVVDGYNLHPILFEILRQRNPHIKCINYLFDTTSNLYHFEENFKYFDKVATFERYDSERYGVELLPISWTTIDNNPRPSYKMFGLGTYSMIRYEMYQYMINLCKDKKLPYRINLYFKKLDNFKFYKLKYYIKRILGFKTNISPDLYLSDIITHEFLSREDFRKIMSNTEIILDTIAFDQDGLTARFMWALGAGKKIITSNNNIYKYDFFTPEQIYVVEDYSDKTKCELSSFIDSKYEMSQEVREMVDQYRIDNWIKHLFVL